MIHNYSSYELTMAGLPFAATVTNHGRGWDKCVLSCKFMLYNNSNTRQTEFFNSIIAVQRTRPYCARGPALVKMELSRVSL